MRSSFALLLLALAVVVLVIAPPLVRVVVAGCMLLAPGYLLWSWLGARTHLPSLAHIAVVIGLSLSTIPLSFLWLNTLGVALPPVALRFGMGVLGGVAVWRIARQPVRLHAPAWLAAGLALVGLLASGVRLYQIRGIVLPLWVDSVHHALLIRIVGETGRIPTSLEPYIAVDPLVYHWGYHVVAATWLALTNLPIPDVMLLGGQLIGAAHVLGVYALGAYLLRSPLGGLFAALITGLLSMMPAYYVTWGRYTQLTGLLLLPALIILSCMVVEMPRLRWRVLVAAALTLAGLLVIHYRVLVFYGAFMLPWSVLFAIARPRRIGSAIGRLATLGALGAAFAAPWVYQIVAEALVPIAQQPGSLAGTDSYNSIDRSLLWTTNSRAIFVMSGVGLLVALVRRRWRIVAVGAWIATMALIANPGVVGLPSSWLINNHSVVITLFLPMSILAGWGVREIIVFAARWIPRRARSAMRLAVALGVVALAVFGAWQFRDVVNQDTNLTAAADLPALAWVAQHAPPDARFLVNAAPWLNRAYRGTDAGWWIMPLAGRWTSTPPSLYDYGSPDYVNEIASRSAQVAALRPSQEAELDAIVRTNRITHVFIGAKGGPLKPDMFWGRPQYEAVYDQDGVVVFAVRP